MSPVLLIGVLVAQGLLMPVLAVLLAGLEGWFAARLAGVPPPPLLLPWRAVRGGFGRQKVRREGASVLTAGGPAMIFAVTWAAACAVPVAGAGGDALAVAGLLMLARVLATGGEDRVALVAEPMLLLALLVRGLPDGGAAGPIGVAALAAAVLVLTGRGEFNTEASGGDLALLRLAAFLRRLVLFALLAGQVVPDPGEGFERRLVAVAATAGVVLVLAGASVLARTAWAPQRPGRRREGLIAGVVLAVLAVLVGLLEAGS